MSETAPEEQKEEQAPPPAEETAETAGDESADDIDTDEWRRGNQVINNFYGDVDAHKAQFGILVETTVRRATGLIGRDDVARDLRYFEPPPPFAKAKETLLDKHLVLLAGAEDIGKRTGALALLTEVLDDAQLSSLSPALTFAQLAAYEHFKKGRGYLIQDRIGDTDAASVQCFEIDRVVARLKRLGAYLVITISAASAKHRHLDEYVVDWEPPHPVELFETCLDRIIETSSDPASVDRARERAASLRTPQAVITLAEHLPRGLDVALAALDDSELVRVTEWLDGTPARREVLAVAALAFAHGLPDRSFEVLLARLVELAEPAVSPGRETDPTLRQSRADWTTHALATVTRDIPELGQVTGERRLVFKSVEYRERVIAELVERYGYELWDPLRTWLNELAAEPPSEVHVQLALGIALLAKTSPGEAEQDYLRLWSDGLAAQRLTAAYVLSWMCIDDRLAPVALRIVLSWTKNAGLRRAMTAAVALGGELGMRYPSDAMRWLWFLAMRAQRVSEVARQSLAFLFCAAVDSSENVIGVLNFLHGLARQEIEGGGDFQRLRLALTALVTVLGGECLDSSEPIAAFMLRTQPESARILGSLWAWTLRSGSHRGRATDALRRTLRAMEGHEDAQAAVHQLGAAVRAGMSTEQLRLLKRDLTHALLTQPAGNKPNRSRQLVSALLVALEGTE